MCVLGYLLTILFVIGVKSGFVNLICKIFGFSAVDDIPGFTVNFINPV